MSIVKFESLPKTNRNAENEEVHSKSIDKTSSDTLSTYFKDSYPDKKHC